MTVYELAHTYYLYENTPYYSYKKLGYYSNLEKLKGAISFYSNLPGFCDAQNAFIVRQKEVQGSVSDNCIYVAYIYAHTEDFENYEHEEELGLFPDESSAKQAIDLFRTNNALFLNNSLLETEQLIDKYFINEHCGWIGGFDVERY